MEKKNVLRVIPTADNFLKVKAVYQFFQVQFIYQFSSSPHNLVRHIYVPDHMSIQTVRVRSGPYGVYSYGISIPSDSLRQNKSQDKKSK